MSLGLPLEALKRDGDLYIFEIDEDNPILFRLPSVKKALQYAKLLLAAENIFDRFLVYEYVFRECIEDKSLIKYNDLPAGVSETVGKIALFLSGVDENFEEYTNLLFEKERSEVNSVITTIKRTICGVFSGYKFSDLDSLNYQELVHIFIQAEQLLIQQGIITEGTKIEKAQEETAPTIGEMVREDVKAYKEFDLEGAKKILNQNPRERARLEEEKYRESLRQKYQRR